MGLQKKQQELSANKIFKSNTQPESTSPSIRQNTNRYHFIDTLCVILKKCHRFRSADRGGLYALAKDLARITADHAGGHWFESSSLHHEPP